MLDVEKRLQSVVYMLLQANVTCLCNLLSGANHLSTRLEILQHMVHSEVDAAAQVHGVHTCRH